MTSKTVSGTRIADLPEWMEPIEAQMLPDSPYSIEIHGYVLYEMRGGVEQRFHVYTAFGNTLAGTFDLERVIRIQDTLALSHYLMYGEFAENLTVKLLGVVPAHEFVD